MEVLQAIGKAVLFIAVWVLGVKIHAAMLRTRYGGEGNHWFQRPRSS